MGQRNARLNRAQRRTRDRNTVRELRNQGCDCTPKLATVDSRRVRSVGATYGFDVRHKRGCPLGDAAYQLNLIGIIPLVVSPTTDTECQR